MCQSVFRPNTADAIQSMEEVQMSIIEVDGLAKTFKIRERGAGLAGSLRSFVAPQYRTRRP